MMLRIYFLMLFMLLAISNAAFAKNGYSSVTGEVLQQKCQTAIDLLDKKLKIQDVKAAAVSSSDSASCFAYISGVNDAAFQLSEKKSYASEIYNEVSKMPYCLPDGEGVNDYVKAVLKYLKKHPDALRERGVTVVYKAFRENYPCF